MRVLLLAAASLLLGAGSAIAQASDTTKGRLELQAGGVVWTPSCGEPRRPARNTTYATAAYNRAVVEYFACIVEQADYDIDMMQRAVVKGREDAARRMQDRLRRNQ